MSADFIKLFALSMLPVIELRGGVVMGLAMGYGFWPVYAVCVLGNLLPVPVLIPFAARVLRLCARLPHAGFLFERLLDSGARKAAKLPSRAIWWGLFAFVAVPLPGTGAWTGSLIAALLGLDRVKSFAAIALGVMASGLIMGMLSFGVSGLFSMLLG